MRPVVKSFIEGENGSVILFGPTEGGKTYTLKGKTGLERGILPRAVEDMFNILRNSEDPDNEYDNFMDSSESGPDLHDPYARPPPSHH